MWHLNLNVETTFTLSPVLADHLMTVDGSLHAKQTPGVVLDPDTGRWSVELQCGIFLGNQPPPFTLQWTVSKKTTTTTTTMTIR
jgi:hypothetical protein